MTDVYEPAPQASRLPEDVDPELRGCEGEINTTTKDMSLLRSEYYSNVCRLRDGYRPKVYPYQHAIHMNKFYLSTMNLETQWLEKKQKAMQLASEGGSNSAQGFFEQRDMAQAKKDFEAPLVAEFQLAFKEMNEVPKHELALLRGYENPPPLVWDTVRTIMQVRGDEDVTWEGAQIIFSDTYYYAFFASRCKQQIRSEILTEDEGVLMASIERYLLQPESTVERVANVSPPCAPMARFLAALYLYAKFLEIVNNKNYNNLAAIRNRLSEQRIKIQTREEDIRGAQEKVELLHQELKQREAELAERYDITMAPLQDLFVQAHEHFMMMYHQKSPVRARNDQTEEL